MDGVLSVNSSIKFIPRCVLRVCSKRVFVLHNTTLQQAMPLLRDPLMDLFGCCRSLNLLTGLLQFISGYKREQQQ